MQLSSKHQSVGGMSHTTSSSVATTMLKSVKKGITALSESGQAVFAALCFKNIVVIIFIFFFLPFVFVVVFPFFLSLLLFDSRDN